MAGSTVLITGASSGIGAATARLLLQRGWRVIAAARRVEAMATRAAAGAIVLPLDIGDSHSRAQLAASVAEHCGHLDALVNNAGFDAVGPRDRHCPHRAPAQGPLPVRASVGVGRRQSPAANAPLGLDGACGRC
jgi:NADP-dependent 3-hydroxy acid dehydrogenase YdfG